MKIVVLDRNTIGFDISMEPIERLGECEIYDDVEQSEIAEAIWDAEVCVTNKKVLGEKELREAKRMKLICLFATGFNNVDIDYCRKRGIRVRNLKNYCTESVCQHTFALLFSLIESIKYYDNFVKSGKYSESGTANHLGRSFFEIAGKRWGIVGMGNIGRAVAKAAEAFGAKVFYASVSGAEREEKWERVSLERLARESDIISIHSPLNEKTEGLIDKSFFEKMKKSAVLINVGRGAVVVGEDLAEAVEKGIIAGAAADVYAKEPPEENDALLRITTPEKLILTPHIAWGSLEARRRCVEETAQNIAAFIAGKERNDVW